MFVLQIRTEMESRTADAERRVRQVSLEAEEAEANLRRVEDEVVALVDEVSG